MGRQLGNATRSVIPSPRAFRYELVRLDDAAYVALPSAVARTSRQR